MQIVQSDRHQTGCQSFSGYIFFPARKVLSASKKMGLIHWNQRPSSPPFIFLRITVFMGETEADEVTSCFPCFLRSSTGGVAPTNATQRRSLVYSSVYSLPFVLLLDKSCNASSSLCFTHSSVTGCEVRLGDFYNNLAPHQPTQTWSGCRVERVVGVF